MPSLADSGLCLAYAVLHCSTTRLRVHLLGGGKTPVGATQWVTDTLFQKILCEKSLKFIENPSKVLQILNEHDIKMSKLKIPDDVPGHEIDWSEWENEKENLLYELMETI
jgi:hypothetical protein